MRNGFATQLEDDTGLDAVLSGVDGRRTKMMTGWISNNVHASGLRNPMKGKSPVDGKALEIASLTSSLGYDVPERPMARLDDAMRAVVRQLGATVAASSDLAGTAVRPAPAALAPASLDTGQVLHLAALLPAASPSSLLQLFDSIGGQIRNPPGAAAASQSHQERLDYVARMCCPVAAPGAREAFSASTACSRWTRRLTPASNTAA